MSSLWALFGQTDTEVPEAVVERVRQSIHTVLEEQLGEEGFELQVRVRFAPDIEGLWYLRPDIMNAIATRRGEAVAHVCMTRLTILFKGHHPSAAGSRFGALGPRHGRQGLHRGRGA